MLSRFCASREVVKGEVFKPRMEGPSMTVEEYGELQLKKAQEREKAPQEKSVRRYEQLEVDGDEDNQRLVDEVRV
jgi:hypothetical protein